ncbi:GDSL-type esterase/lipase family protein [Mesorhizobium sp. M0933]|uniref:GDSL-type esterase/lipase family protein n=1 Tax=Mesorhizobium sp. M0933 TaxID=2957030 RepID=UPI00333CE4FC
MKDLSSLLHHDDRPYGRRPARAPDPPRWTTATRGQPNPNRQHEKPPMRAGQFRLADAIASGDFSQQIAAATVIGGTFPAIEARMASVDYSLLDYLIPSFGTNDFTGAGPTCPIGTNADITGATFKGAINYGIQTIMTARPNLKLIFTTPIWRTLDGTAGGAGSQLIDYANAMLEVCALNRVPVVDLYRRCIINQFNYVHWMGPGDGTHPNNLGQDLIGGMMAAGLFDNF